MSSYEYEPFDENTPLLSNNDSNRSKYPTTNQHVLGCLSIENISAEHKNQNTSSQNYSCLSTDKENNNSSNVEEGTSGVDSQPQDIRVYAKRWYILAVLSVLGVLQVCTLSK